MVSLAFVGCGQVGPVDDRDPGPFAPLAVPTDTPRAGDVDPFLGTANQAHTFPGPVMPWGMASPSPHTSVRNVTTFFSEGPANAGYLSGAPTIHGFGQTHLSGTGCPDLGAPVIAPTVGDVLTGFNDYGSAYENEHAHAGYYATTLTDAAVHVELTATPRVGLTRLWFPNRDGDANVLVDVGRALSFRRGAGSVHVVSPRELEGTVDLGFFCGNNNRPRLHFVVRFDHDAIETGTWTRGMSSEAPDAAGHAGGFFRFDTRRGEPVLVAVALSWVSADNARENLDAEVGVLDGSSFEEAHTAATQSWQETLERIRVEGDESARRRFTTALYHALLLPNVASDVNGEFLRADGDIGRSDDERYTVFSMWDTYRTLHPLLCLVYPERQTSMMRSLVALTEELGEAPKWELISEEVNMMVGDPLAIVAADSHARGIRDFDIEGLYAQLADDARNPEHRPGLAGYLELGYVPMEDAPDVWGPVSTTLEYALADASLARLATELGHAEDAAEFLARSTSYTALFDAATGLLRPKHADGSFLDPFDPDALEGSAIQDGAGGPGYVEGSAWTYAFMVPHDIEGLVTLYGGETPFLAQLTELFDTDRFVLWNEPYMAYPYFFARFDGGRAQTERIVRESMARYFTDGPAGLPGNDDTGTLSAWFVFSAMGLYPDLPGVARYTLGSPLFDRVEITRGPDAPPFVIVATDNAPENVYVTSRVLDGVPVETPFLQHADIADGGTLTLRMSSTP